MRSLTSWIGQRPFRRRHAPAMAPARPADSFAQGCFANFANGGSLIVTTHLSAGHGLHRSNSSSAVGPPTAAPTPRRRAPTRGRPYRTIERRSLRWAWGSSLGVRSTTEDTEVLHAQRAIIPSLCASVVNPSSSAGHGLHRSSFDLATVQRGPLGNLLLTSCFVPVLKTRTFRLQTRTNAVQCSFIARSRGLD